MPAEVPSSPDASPGCPTCGGELQGPSTCDSRRSCDDPPFGFCSVCVAFSPLGLSPSTSTKKARRERMLGASYRVARGTTLLGSAVAPNRARTPPTLVDTETRPGTRGAQAGETCLAPRISDPPAGMICRMTRGLPSSSCSMPCPVVTGGGRRALLVTSSYAVVTFVPRRGPASSAHFFAPDLRVAFHRCEMPGLHRSRLAALRTACTGPSRRLVFSIRSGYKEGGADVKLPGRIPMDCR